jgi:hypothetical protein
MATLAQLHDQLDSIDAKIEQTVDTGLQYSLSGSHSATQHTLDALNKQRSRIIRRIRLFRGYSSKSSPSYS